VKRPPSTAPARPNGALSIDTLAADVRAGNRRALAKAITLVESTRNDHQRAAQQLLERLLPHTGGAARVGISGVPGVGNKHTWSVKSLTNLQGRFGGFFPHYVAQAQQVANWFRATDHTQNPPVVSGDVAFVSP